MTTNTINHGYFFYEELTNLVSRIWGDRGVILCDIRWEGEKEISSYDTYIDGKFYHRVFHFRLNEKGEN